MHSKLILVFLITALSVQADEILPTLTVGADTFTNVTITKVTPTDVYFLSSSGMGNAKLKDLDPETQKHFKFNFDQAEAL